MGPPPFSDGNDLDTEETASNLLPSMEPPPFSDGNGIHSQAILREQFHLQWGHRLSAMET